MTARILLAAAAISTLLRRHSRRPGQPRDLQIVESRTGARSGARNAGGLPEARLSGDGRRRRPLRRHAGAAARPLRRPSHGVDRFGQGMDRGQLSHQHDRTQCHQPARHDAGRNPQPARRRHRRRRVDGRSRQAHCWGLSACPALPAATRTRPAPRRASTPYATSSISRLALVRCTSSYGSPARTASLRYPS